MDAIQTKEAGTGRTLRESSAYVNLADRIDEMTGGKGMTHIDGTGLVIPPTGMVFIEIHFVEDSVLETLTTQTGAEIIGNTITGLPYGADFVLVGRFTGIKLTSGRAFAYHGALI